MYAPAIEELVTTWAELEAELGMEAEIRDLAAELLVDEFDIWTLADAGNGEIKWSICGGCGTYAPLDGDE
jgi:hypothetical protein